MIFLMTCHEVGFYGTYFNNLFFLMAQARLDRQLYDAVKRGKPGDVIEALLHQGANPEAPVGKGSRTAVMRADEKQYMVVAGRLRAETLRRGSGKPLDEESPEVRSAA